MTNKDLFFISFKNILRNKVKFLLIIISICIGITSVTIISSIGNIASKIIDKELSALGIDGISIIDTSDENILNEEIFNIFYEKFDTDIMMPMKNSVGSYSSTRAYGTAFFFGVYEQVEELLKLEILHGRSFNKSDISTESDVAIISVNLANDIYARDNIIGKYLSLSINGVRKDFEIVGIVENQTNLMPSFGTSSATIIYVPATTLAKYTENSAFDQIAIRTSGDLAVLEEEIEYYISKNSLLDGNFSVQNISSYIDIISNITLYVTILLTFIAGISMVVAGISVTNIILSSTIERKKEIGIYLALGAKKSEVLKIFLLESVIICLFSGVLGAIIGVLVVMIIVSSLGFEFYLSYETLISVILVSLFCGIISGVFPGLKASNLNPIDVLRE